MLEPVVIIEPPGPLPRMTPGGGSVWGPPVGFGGVDRAGDADGGLVREGEGDGDGEADGKSEGVGFGEIDGWVTGELASVWVQPANVVNSTAKLATSTRTEGPPGVRRAVR